MAVRKPRERTGVELLELQLGDHELIVLRVDDGPHQRVEGLTAAEREVALDAMAGHSNKEIAARRGSKMRTVANQLAAVYRKLGVSSRAELAARLTTDGKTD